MRSIDGIMALVRRGVTTLRAKRAIEAVMENGRVLIQVPLVESGEALRIELADAGFAAARVDVTTGVDIRGLRKRLGLTREQFALHYGLEVETLRNWETGRREPDATARSYLRAIFNDPRRVEEAYAPTPS